MKETLCCCVFLLILGQNISAAIIHEVVEERTFTRMRCPRRVEGRVTWSRETRGTRTDVLTIDGDTVTRHIHDPYKYYHAEGRYTLLIYKVKTSDSGRYFCNDEAAVDLTVIPSATSRLHTKRSSSISLTCPPAGGGSDDPTWSTDAGEIKQQERFEVFPVDGSLIIRDVQPADSGLYYCDGQPAVYLNVTEDHQPDRGFTSKPTPTPTTPGTTKTAATDQRPTTVKDKETTTTKKSRKKPQRGKGKKTTTSKPTPTPTTPGTTKTAATDQRPTTMKDKETTTKNRKSNKKSGKDKDKNRQKKPTQTPTPPSTTQPAGHLLKTVLAITLPVLLLIFALTVTVVCCRRCRLKKKDEEAGPVYCEIQDGLLPQETKASSNPDDHTYSTITEIPLMKKETVTALPDESPYSLIEDTSVGGNIKGGTESPYYLVDDQNTPANNNNLTSAV